MVQFLKSIRKVIYIFFRKNKVCHTIADEEIKSEQKVKKKLIAYSISGNDIDFMWKTTPHAPGCCEVCNIKLKEVINPRYKIGKRRNDMYITYDGYYIVSKFFKMFCEENECRGVGFTKISDSFFYHLHVTEECNVDKRFIVTHGEKTQCCNQYPDVTARITYLNNYTNDKHIKKTDVWFSNGRCKNPDIIVSIPIAKAMKEYGLKGIYFHEVYEAIKCDNAGIIQQHRC